MSPRAQHPGDDTLPEERRLLRSRDGRKEPSALRLAAIRDQAQARWRQGHRQQLRTRRASRAALGASLAVVAAVFLAVAPPSRTADQWADASGCSSAESGAYCPPAWEDGCQLFSPHPLSCF